MLTGWPLTRVLVVPCCVLLTAVVSGPAFAQSSVTLQSSSASAPPPVPTKPLEILDSDYPIGSLFANEEGQTDLNLILNETGGVRVVQIIGSSGSPALDGTAATIARTRWSFEPGSVAPAGAEARVSIEWNLPLRPATEYTIELPPPPSGTVVLPVATNSHAVIESDYPGASIRAREEGTIALAFRINEGGTTDSVRILGSSGYPRLDLAATKLIGRWTYVPAMVDGSPTDHWVTARVAFFFERDGQACFDRPPITAYDNQIRAPNENALGRQWWLLIGANGTVSEALMQTRAGWMRVSDAIVRTIPTARLFPPNTRFIRRPRSTVCWLNVNLGS